MALFCCFSLPGLAQLGRRSHNQDSHNRARLRRRSRRGRKARPRRVESGRRITLDVVVTDKSGKPVPGLQQQDFTLLDDNQPQAILSFRATDLATNDSTNLVDSPLQAILLVDAVNTSFRSVGYERQELQKFLQRTMASSPFRRPCLFLPIHLRDKASRRSTETPWWKP